MLDALASDDELCLIIAHEVSHLEGRTPHPPTS